ncbi:plasmid partition protein (plasmid) [Duffyella gerundensis]|jgi:hypothetical protein|uniref:plasmid partition protein ParG n=1 Tax=Erwiniaceae TaxID=1903409 RepID=UPI0016545A92|nr:MULTISPECIES: plasmid partition protein ParG [Erwiniaceae]UCB33484.1 plasmid partition protein [Duffyella gerundensis]
MSLQKKHEAKKMMAFGEHRDVQKVLESKPTGKTKRVNVNLDEELHTRFKSVCARKGTSISKVLEDHIHEWLRENE